MNTFSYNKLMQLFQTASAAYYVLSSWGISPDKPFLIISESGANRLISDINYCDGNDKLTSMNKMRDIAEALQLRRPDPVILYFDNSYRAISRFDFIKNQIKVGEAVGGTIKRLPIVVSDTSIDEGVGSDAFLVLVDNHTSIEFSIWDILPKPTDFSLIEERIHSISAADPNEYFLKCVVQFMYPYYRDCNRFDLFEEMMLFVESIIQNNEEAKDKSGLSEMFIKTLFEFKVDGEKPRLYELPELEKSVIEMYTSYIFHDGIYLYISTELFELIVQKLNTIASVRTIKDALVEDGHLIMQKDSYTSKVSMWDQHGVPYRKRMLKFLAKNLKKPIGEDIIGYLGGSR